ncbi:hypothetical protein GCM10010513_18440 [Streptomyces glebosus]|nr:hypothetical protein GCM10010513_18440 [Streptomyces glebosus]
MRETGVRLLGRPTASGRARCPADRTLPPAAGAPGAARASLPGYWDAFVSHIGTGVSE